MLNITCCHYVNLFLLLVFPTCTSPSSALPFLALFTLKEHNQALLELYNFLVSSAGAFSCSGPIVCLSLFVCVRVCVCVCASGQGIFVFIDLKKAYDSVPRGCLWQVLGRAGVPEKLINIIRSFHDPMSASVQFNNILSDPFSIGNGLRQGCSMAPVLFNIFMWAVMTQWQHRVRRVDGVGFELRSAYSSDLYRKPRRDDQHHCLTDSQFADDSCLFATTRSGAGAALCCLHEVASGFGLTISATKTQFVVVGPGITLTDRAPLQLGQAEVECVPHFKYLGSVVDSGCRSSRDIAARIAHSTGDNSKNRPLKYMP